MIVNLTSRGLLNLSRISIPIFIFMILMISLFRNQRIRKQVSTYCRTFHVNHFYNRFLMSSVSLSSSWMHRGFTKQMKCKKREMQTSCLKNNNERLHFWWNCRSKSCDFAKNNLFLDNFSRILNFKKYLK